MKMNPVTSGNISAIGYDARKAQLNVEFKNGKAFGYKDVHIHEVIGLEDAQSVGKHFNQHIKPNKEAFEVLGAEEVEAEEVFISKELDCSGLVDIQSEEVNELKAHLALMKEEMLTIEAHIVSTKGDKLVLAVARKALSTFKE